MLPLTGFILSIAGRLEAFHPIERLARNYLNTCWKGRAYAAPAVASDAWAV